MPITQPWKYWNIYYQSKNFLLVKLNVTAERKQYSLEVKAREKREIFKKRINDIKTTTACQIHVVH